MRKGEGFVSRCPEHLDLTCSNPGQSDPSKAQKLRVGTPRNSVAQTCRVLHQNIIAISLQIQIDLEITTKGHFRETLIAPNIKSIQFPGA